MLTVLRVGVGLLLLVWAVECVAIAAVLAHDSVRRWVEAWLVAARDGVRR